MNEKQHLWLGLALHLVPAVVCFAAGLHLVTTAEGFLEAVSRLLAGMALLVAGSVLIARPVARLLALPWGGLFFPDERYTRPPPRYSIAATRVKEGRYAEALAMYEKIAADYPDELKPHVAMLELAARHLRDPARAEAIYQRSRAALRRPALRAALARQREALLFNRDLPAAALEAAAAEPEPPPRRGRSCRTRTS